MKLLSGRALSTPEGTQTSHRLSVRPAGAAVRPVLYCRFDIKFCGMNKSWHLGRSRAKRLATVSGPVDSGELLHIPQLGDKRVYQK